MINLGRRFTRHADLAPIQLFVVKTQSWSIVRLQIVDSNRCWFSVDVNHPVELFRRFLFNIANGFDHPAVRGEINGEVVAGMLVCGLFQDVMRVCTIHYFDACAGRSAWSTLSHNIRESVHFKQKLHANGYRLWNSGK